jgi:uncharacterized membrane protein
MLIPALRFIHVFSNFIWMGAFLFIGAYLSNRKQEITLQEARTINWLYNRFELPGLIGSLVCGVLLIFLSPTVSFKAGWFHLKLTAVFFLIIVDLFLFKKMLSVSFLFEKNGKGILIPRVLGGLFFLIVLASIYLLQPFMEAT